MNEQDFLNSLTELQQKHYFELKEQNKKNIVDEIIEKIYLLPSDYYCLISQELVLEEIQKFKKTCSI